MTADNLNLWNQVCSPDEKHTRNFSRGGGFKGTTTNVNYLIKRATELWGPMGGTWGVNIMDERYVNGAPLLAEANVIGHEIIHVIRIELRHPGGVVPGIGQTQFVGRNKNGLFTDEEAPKKSLTDALSKALSWLGFAADIHMGLWDDNKHVNRRDEDEPAPRGRRERQDAPTHSEVQTITAAQAKTLADTLEADRIGTVDFFEWLKGHKITVTEIEHIPSAAYSNIVKALNKRRADKAKGNPEGVAAEARS